MGAKITVEGKDYGVYLETASHTFYFYSGIIRGSVNSPYKGSPSTRSSHRITTKKVSDKHNAYIYYYSPPSSGGGGDSMRVPQFSCEGSACHPSNGPWG